MNAIKTHKKYIKIDTPYGQYKVYLCNAIRKKVEYDFKNYNLKNTSDYSKDIIDVENNIIELYWWIIQKTKWEDWKKYSIKINDKSINKNNFWKDIYYFELLEE